MDFNQSPYYDDYSDEKHFYKILFKPGVAVQARELNQLQTIIKKQISRFGDHIFNTGSIVIPGSLNVDKNFNYVKLESLYDSNAIDVSDFLNRPIIGQSSGVQAKVVLTAAAEDSDPPTIFVKYLDSGTNNTTNVFQTGEVIQTNDGNTTSYATVVSSSATGKCIGVTIDKGIFYIDENFVQVESQSIVLDKYLSNSTYNFGLTVNESIVNYQDDESLLDPALGTYNSFAPGADRHKIDLILSKRETGNVISSDTFINLGKVVNGEVIELTNNRPGYNLLADELARRTYDESGNYTVDSFKLKVIEHLKTDLNPDGFLTSGEGGDEDYAIAVLSPGKSYVRGYEVSTRSNKYLTFQKPRDLANVENSVVRTQMGNYVELGNSYGIPNFTTDLKEVKLYNRYTSSQGNISGNLVGTAKTRGYETFSGNVMQNDNIFTLFIFDVDMADGYTFDRDVKQIYHANVTGGSYSSSPFTANIIPQKITQTGTLTLTQNSNVFSGVNTVFSSYLKPDEYIRPSTDTANVYRIVSVSVNSIQVDKAYPLANVSGVTFTKDTALIKEKEKSAYLFPFQNDVVTNVSDITIRTRKVFYGSLTAGVINLTTVAGTEFASRTDLDYFVVIASGSNRGKYYRIDSGQFSYTDSPTNRNIEIDLSSYSLTNEDVLVYTTIIKTSPTAKSKTITAGETVYIDRSDCIKQEISIGKADVMHVANVKMSANAFGTAYNSSNEIDISDRFILDSGQTETYYGISKLKLAKGKQKPTGPIKISFYYYAHGSGDFFTSDSYQNYNLIPVFVDKGIEYHLRDYIDFRPRIDDTGTDFSGTGASRNDFLDFSSDFICDYQYYLPRIDKIFISGDKKFSYLTGVSSLNPVEPQTPSDSMTLYIINHPAYPYDINKDSTFTAVDQRRYTMKDIGKLDSRITNLEYYTQLSLLELDTSVFSVKDSYGLDRYKNGFVVESFRGHGIGDVKNKEYQCSMDIDNGFLMPSFFQKNVKLTEIAPNSSDRTANGYTLINNTTVMLTYEDELYTGLNLADSDISITPFDVFVYNGVLKLDPSSDTWYDETFEPIITRNSDGTWDSMIPDSVGEKIYGTVWRSWKTSMPEPSVEIKLNI